MQFPRVTLLLALVCVVAYASAGRASDERARHHAFLEWEAGDWDADITLMNPADGTMQKFKGHQRDRMSGCGLWLVTDLQLLAGADGASAPPYEGHGVLGYDPEKGKLVGLWVDSQTTWLAVAEGSLDAAGTTLTLAVEGRHPQTGKPMPRQFVTRKVDAHTKKMDTLIPGPEGSFITVATITYTRAR